MSARLPAWAKDRFEIPGDMVLLERLTAEMHASDPESRPAHWWMLSEQDAKSSMSFMLDGWNGPIGGTSLSELSAQPGAEELACRTLQFARQIDHANVLGDLDMQRLASMNWRVMDLIGLVEAQLISAVCPLNQSRILEVGGGFGRVAEFLYIYSGGNLSYVNIDAVPTSIMYCKQYLSRMFPDKSVQVYNPDDRSSHAADFLIVPAWHAAKALKGNFDLCINIESFQEMSQTLVDGYIDLFRRCVRDSGHIFMTNSRDYKFQGTWSFPDNWECVLKHRSPWAWTANHPTEIYRAGGSTQHAMNVVRDVFFLQDVARLKSGG